MDARRCRYVLLVACLLGVGLGIVLVLVLINTLVVPLHDNLQPMAQTCLVVDISPVTPYPERDPESAATGQRRPKEVKARPKLNNEVLKDDEILSYVEGHPGLRKGCGQSDHNASCLYPERQKLIRHGNGKTNQIASSTIGYPERSCYSVRVQFLVETLEADVSLSSVVREGFLRQAVGGATCNERFLQTPNENISFCCNCRRENASNNAGLIFDGGRIQNGQSVLCQRLTNSSSTARSKSINWLLFNAMFWPTLIFILGFVGLFFVGIQLAKENSKKNKGSIEARTLLARSR